MDKMYCAQQISIPTELPNLLKNFTKAAIRTQPKDLLLWSAAYFSALSAGERLPVKDRLEMNVATQKTDTGLTPGLLKTLHKQLSLGETCSKEELQKKWKGLCLPVDQLETLLSLGSFSSDIDWMEFLALGCSALGGAKGFAQKTQLEQRRQIKENILRNFAEHMMTLTLQNQMQISINDFVCSVSVVWAILLA